MLLILALIFISISLIYRFPFLAFFIGIGLISYPYLITKYNSSTNLLNSIIKAIKNWLQTGKFKLENDIEIISKIPEDAFIQDVYDKSSEKTDILDTNIKNENLRKVLILFPELELFQKWLIENQDYYVAYQHDVFAIWTKILNKIVDIVSNPNSYVTCNMTDLLNLQIQLLNLFEFCNDMSSTTNPNSTIAVMITNINRHNREFNSNLVKWIKNNRGETTTRGCPLLNDFEVSDWVSPSNLMALQ